MILPFVMGLGFFLSVIHRPVIASEKTLHEISTTPQTKIWKPLNDNVSLVYSDDHLAAYFEPNVDPSIIWPFDLLSQAWNYTKETYGPFGQDPRLYLILHNGKYHNCTSSPFTKKQYHYHNVIECETINSLSDIHEGTHNSSENLEYFLEHMGCIIRHGAKGIFNDADLEVSVATMQTIVVYDIYLELKRPNKTSYKDEINFINESVEQWKNITMNNSYGNIFWYRDWYLPIYERFGGASVLDRFYNYTHKYWKRKYEGDYIYMNKGEFIHFWSGAAGVDLLPLAESFMVISRSTKNQLAKARNTYTNFDYLENKTTKELPAQNPPGKWLQQETGTMKESTLTYVDKSVAIYMENFQLYPISSFKLISTVWKYTQEIYLNNYVFPLLYIYIQNGAINECHQLNNSLNAIHCTTTNNENETHVPHVPLNEITLCIALKVLKFNPQMSDGTTRSYWPAQNISQETIISLMIYDIYSNLGCKDNAKRWKEAKLTESESFPRNKTFWFRDWYFKIYENSNKTNAELKLLQNFFALLHSNWPFNRDHSVNVWDIKMQLNMGEFVHFWSGSVGSSVKEVAMEAFGWEPEDDIQLMQARMQYSNITYKIKESNETFPNYIIVQDKLFTSETLVNGYQDGHVGVYFLKSNLPHQIDWALYLISYNWRYLNRNYPDTLELNSSSNPHLYATFLPGESKRCETLSSLNAITDSGEKKIPLLIHCNYAQGFQKSGWTKENWENIEILMGAFEKILRLKMGLQLEGNDYNQKAIKATSSVIKVIIYDLHYQKWGPEGAERWRRSWGENKISSVRDEDWFTDWYLPIYQSNNRSYGIGGAEVLNRFTSLLNSTSKHGTKVKENMNLGELVHLWSEAANKDLRVLAQRAFGFSSNEKEFKKAREEYPQFSYFCSECDTPNPPQDESQQEPFIPVAIIIIVGVSLLFALLLSCCFETFASHYNHRFRIIEQQITMLNTYEVDDFIKGTDVANRRQNVYVNPFDPNASIYSKPFNRSYELDKERLLIDLDRELGSGQFGVVYMGVIKPETEDANGTCDVQVAVKTVKPGVDVNCFKAMIMEIKIMAYLGHHENIVSLLATVTLNIQKLEVLVALEYCSKGDLLSNLIKSRESFVDLWNKQLSKCYFKNDNEPFVKLAPESPSTSNCENNSLKPVCTLDILRWSRDTANGLAFLGEKQVIHGDLAARNVLITGDGVAKVGDFGLSRQVLNYENYMKKTNTPLPWRWMAIESLNERNFSVYSDIWSYGVTLWEIFSLGKLPFEMRAWDQEFMNMLRTGTRLESPQYANLTVYNLMLDCWKNEPKERISFACIINNLDQIIESFKSNQLSTSEDYSYFLAT